MILMQAHARTERVAVAGLEKMLAKVPWALGDVSLYVERTARSHISSIFSAVRSSSPKQPTFS